MIKLIFTRGRETFSIEIENKIIVYRDRKYQKGFVFMPENSETKRIILFSRNRLPMEILTWIKTSNSGRNLEQYNSAKDDEALVPIIKNDAAINGCVFQQKIYIENDKKRI